MKFTNGLLILVEGDTPNKTEWFQAYEWQATEFIKVMRFGEMKSMGYPNIEELSKPFTYRTYEYRFIIKNDWGPCFLHNMTTGKQREVQYFQIGLESNSISKTTFIKLD